VVDEYVTAVASEEVLIRRVVAERELRGWSPALLAQKMTEAGCPMAQSSIWKMEHGNPHRKITLDETLCFARVFGTSLDDLLLPPELRTDRKALRLVATARGTAIMVERLEATARGHVIDLLRHLREHPMSRSAVLEVIRDASGGPYALRLDEFPGEDGEWTDEELDGLIEALERQQPNFEAKG
jgi:transcriptional regulator with XRE-family HTH domain